jgi:hypothetical protein
LLGFRQVGVLPSEMEVGAKRGRRCRPDTPHPCLVIAYGLRRQRLSD